MSQREGIRRHERGWRIAQVSARFTGEMFAFDFATMTLSAPTPPAISPTPFASASPNATTTPGPGCDNCFRPVAVGQFRLVRTRRHVLPWPGAADPSRRPHPLQSRGAIPAFEVGRPQRILPLWNVSTSLAPARHNVSCRLQSKLWALRARLSDSNARAASHRSEAQSVNQTPANATWALDPGCAAHLEWLSTLVPRVPNETPDRPNLHNE